MNVILTQGDLKKMAPCDLKELLVPALTKVGLKIALNKIRLIPTTTFLATEFSLTSVCPHKPNLTFPQMQISIRSRVSWETSAGSGTAAYSYKNRAVSF